MVEKLIEVAMCMYIQTEKLKLHQIARSRIMDLVISRFGPSFFLRNTDAHKHARTLIPINTRETHTEVYAYVKAHNSLL